MSDELLRHALTCAERGWHVFPCAPGAKPPAFRGEDWQELSTTAPSRIERWWRARPYNIGVDCGKSGLTALDLDVPGHGRQGHSPDRGTGMDTLLSLCARQGQPLPDATFTVATPSGGYHLCYTAPVSSIGNSWEKLGRLIDVRGTGGYILAAGSRIGGRPYDLLSPAQPASFPAWLAELHEKPGSPACPHPANRPASVRNGSAYAQAALADEARTLATARKYPGFALNRAAFKLGQLVRAGLLERDEVRAVLAGAAAGTDLSSRQIIRAIERGMTAGERTPRHRPGSAQPPEFRVPRQSGPGRTPRW